MNNTTFDWAIIGAGPAGIAALGKLIDHGIEPKKIAWLDPEFKVGDFGAKWRNVSSNTKVKLFLKYFEECKSFQYPISTNDFAITKADPQKTCLLTLAAEPLQWITDHLKHKVHSIQGKAQKLKLYDRHWEITLTDSILRAKNVVLATGAEPKSLPFSGIEEIPLATALDPDKLKTTCNKEDVVAVFGASHSAIIILKTLLENCQIKKVVNFYLSPLRYAVYFDDWILFDDTGLKGNAAQWAREHIDGKLPVKLERVISNEENIRVSLPLCNKAIYATGFQKRLIPIEGMHTLEYNDRSGIIAPGLFGLGIAFPEAKVDRYGTLEYRVGLWKFMDYLNRVMPIWLNYGT
jgi:cation diffusion facilitator CzcD-associated flavoprotein CzcO